MDDPEVELINLVNSENIEGLRNLVDEGATFPYNVVFNGRKYADLRVYASDEIQDILMELSETPTPNQFKQLIRLYNLSKVKSTHAHFDTLSWKKLKYLDV